MASGVARHVSFAQITC